MQLLSFFGIAAASRKQLVASGYASTRLLSRTLEACQRLRLLSNLRSWRRSCSPRRLLVSVAQITGLRFGSQAKTLLCALRSSLHRGVARAAKRFFSCICRYRQLLVLEQRSCLDTCSVTVPTVC